MAADIHPLEPEELLNVEKVSPPSLDILAPSERRNITRDPSPEQTTLLPYVGKYSDLPLLDAELIVHVAP